MDRKIKGWEYYTVSRALKKLKRAKERGINIWHRELKCQMLRPDPKIFPHRLFTIKIE